MDEDPDHMAIRILSLRSFARAKAVIDRAETAADVPAGPQFELVKEIDFMLAAEAIARRRAQEAR
jgi:hypothetical protein